MWAPLRGHVADGAQRELDRPSAGRPCSAPGTHVEAEAGQRAQAYFQAAYAAQMRGALDEAITLYEQSLACVPTAEAYTYLGWTLSRKGDYEGAIRACHRAIEVDPTFGNPYNDIGSYLITLGQPRTRCRGSGRRWAQQRYEPRHYPHVNLARVYVKLRQLDAAIAQLRVALAIAPQYRPARTELHRLLGLLN